MRVLMLGGTGVAGRAALPRLADHDVAVLARTDTAARAVAEAGARPLTGDPDDPGQLRRWLVGIDVAIDLRVRIPSPARALLPGAWREYRRLRDQAAGRLVDAAIDVGTPRLVHDTITMVYADGGDRLLDERSAVAAPGFAAANLACEAHLARLTAAGGTGIALRLAQLYGPDDVLSRQLVGAARRGLLLLPVAPEAWTSALHSDDAGAAIALAAGVTDLTAGVYNVADDEPLRGRDLLTVLSAAAGRRVRAPLTPLARAVPMLARSQRIDSAAFRSATGWAPSVPSRRLGWPAVFEQHTG